MMHSETPYAALQSASPVFLRSMDVQLTIQKVHKYLRDAHKPSVCMCV